MGRTILTADPDFVDLAVEELEHGATAAQLLLELAPGVLLMDCAEDFEELAGRWQPAPPIFVRHLCPVQAVVALADPPAGVQTLEQVVVQEIAPLLDRDLAFSVQCRILAEMPYKPFDINNALAAAVWAATGAPLDVRAPEQVLSIICAATDGRLSLPRRAAFCGWSLAIHNLSDWAGGVRRFAREEGQISRAEFKLLEALETFQVALPPNGVALDLGAAPGGWTRVLRRWGQYVTAVDPATLDTRLEADRSVRHKRMTAQEYLEADPDSFDIIVNDMRMDARDSARLMVRYARCLYPHGIVLMTFKLPEQNRRQVLDHAFNILQEAYLIAGARQLFHNRSEITVYLKRKTLDTHESTADR